MNVKTASRILDIFEAFAESKRSLTLSELAEQIDTPVSSCFALLKTLENRGYLHTLATRREMYPTRRLLKLAQQIAEYDSVTEPMQKALQKLCQDTGETVVLSALHKKNNQIVYVDVHDSSHSIRYNPSIGETKSPHCSSGGKALLSLLDDKSLKETIAELDLERRTPYTIISPSKLFDDIVQARSRGWFTNISESIEDLIGIAVPVANNDTYYAISIAGPVYRLEPNIEKIAQQLISIKTLIEEGK